MLSPDEMDLVRRDTAIPGLATVLDPDAFAAALRGAAPEAALRSAQITYARYKPQTYCRVAYRLDLGGAELDADVRACRQDDLSSWLEDHEKSGTLGPLGPGHLVHAVLEDCAVLVSAFPNDLKLPGLWRLTNPKERKQLLSELLPDQPNLWQGELRCLRYRPERRYVAELRAACGTAALLKSYTARAYIPARRNASAFQSRGPLRIARPLGCSDSRRLLAFEWLPGRLLSELWLEPEVDCKAVTTTGTALAMLHSQYPEELTWWTREAEAAELISLASELGFICPRLARRADELGRWLAARLSGAPAIRRPMHGDFSAKQVLVSQQELSIIDLDWACYGDPSDDLGNLIAQAERFALNGEISPSKAELIKEALVEGYASATNRSLPERIGLYTAVELFRRTRFPVRSREPDWPQRTEALLERAEAISRQVL
jgi:hypothetical protein